jgi:hypothetical protein
VIALHLPDDRSVALIIAALLLAADVIEPDPTAYKFRRLAHQIGDGLDALPTPHQQPTGDPT